MIRQEVGPAGARPDDVGSEDGEIQFLEPFVVDGMTRLDVVVAHGRHVITHIVQHAGGNVLLLGNHIVVIVGNGLPLENIPVVEQIDVFSAVFPPQFFYQGTDPRHGAASGLAGDEVVGEERTVNVRGLYELEGNVFLLCHGGRTES